MALIPPIFHIGFGLNHIPLPDREDRDVDIFFD